jgi:hypothetical protein
MPRALRKGFRRFAFVAASAALAAACVHDWDGFEPRTDASDAMGDAAEIDAQCVAPLENCNGVCADLTNDIAHCGSCVRRCRRGSDCVMGACQ